MSTMHFRTSFFVFLLLTVATGCKDQSGVARVAGVIAEQESFEFKHLKLRKNSSGGYDVKIKQANQCGTVTLSESDLINAMRNGTYRATTGVTTRDLPFTFDLLAECNTPGEIKFTTKDLRVVDANGTITPVHLAQVNARLSDGGVLNLRVHRVLLIVTNPAGTKATGPMNPSTVEVPGDLVGAAAGDVYTPANVTGAYFNFNLKNILANPGRVVGEFAFTARKPGNDNELLLVWGGDFVIQT